MRKRSRNRIGVQLRGYVHEWSYRAETRSISTPCAGTDAEYSPLANFTSLCAQRSFADRTEPFSPRSLDFTVALAGALSRLTTPTATLPSFRGLTQVSR